MAEKIFDADVEEFHNTIIDLIKKYQFRDRNEVSCMGMSVSQCYILETLYSYGSMNMKDLSCKMHLAISTITRIVDQLEKKKYVTRVKNDKDQREKYISLTNAGEEVFLESWKNVFESEKKIFEKIKKEHRRPLLDLLSELNRSVDLWQNSCKKR